MEKRTNPRLVKRTKALVLMIVMVVAMCVAQPFLWQMVSSSSEKLQMEKSKAKQIEAVKSLREEVKKEYKEQQPFLDQLTVVVPMRRDILQVIERLEELAQKEGLAISVESIKEGKSLDSVNKKKKKQEGPSIYPLTLSVKAVSDPGLLVRYIEAVENAREVTAIQSFSISPVLDRSGNSYAYKLEMDVNFYLQGNGDSEGNK